MARARRLFLVSSVSLFITPLVAFFCSDISFSIKCAHDPIHSASNLPPSKCVFKKKHMTCVPSQANCSEAFIIEIPDLKDCAGKRVESESEREDASVVAGSEKRNGVANWRLQRRVVRKANLG